MDFYHLLLLDLVTFHLLQEMESLRPLAFYLRLLQVLISQDLLLQLTTICLLTYERSTTSETN